jgi:hypothetical protein
MWPCRASSTPKEIPGKCLMSVEINVAKDGNI